MNALPEFTVEIHDVPIPTAGPDEVVIKVVAAGSNVKGDLYFEHSLIPDVLDIIQLLKSSP